MDGLELRRQRHESGVGIYLSFDGDKLVCVHTIVHTPSNTIAGFVCNIIQMEVFYIGCIPAHVRLFETLDIIVKDLMHFEYGFALSFGSTGKQEIFFGTLRKVMGMFCAFNNVVYLFVCTVVQYD